MRHWTSRNTERGAATLLVAISVSVFVGAIAFLLHKDIRDTLSAKNHAQEMSELQASQLRAAEFVGSLLRNKQLYVRSNKIYEAQDEKTITLKNGEAIYSECAKWNDDFSVCLQESQNKFHTKVLKSKEYIDTSDNRPYFRVLLETRAPGLQSVLASTRIPSPGCPMNLFNAAGNPTNNLFQVHSAMHFTHGLNDSRWRWFPFYNDVVRRAHSCKARGGTNTCVADGEDYLIRNYVVYHGTATSDMGTYYIPHFYQVGGKHAAKTIFTYRFRNYRLSSCALHKSWQVYYLTSGCLHPDSMIRMAGSPSQKRLGDIVAGDQVFNPLTGKAMTVVAPMSQEKPDARHMVIKTATATLRLSDNHPVMTPSGVVQAKDIEIGEAIITDDQQPQTVVAVNVLADADEGYVNLWLDVDSKAYEDHVFIADGVVVGDFYLQEQLAGIDGSQDGAQ